MFAAAKRCPKMDSRCRGLFLAGLVDEHHRDVIDNGINPPTSCAAQAILLVGHLDRLLTGWANENIEQLLSNRHASIVFAFCWDAAMLRLYKSVMKFY
jgi:hypothetical protein